MKKTIYFTSKPNNIGGGGTFQLGFQNWLIKNTKYNIDYLNFTNTKTKQDIIFIMHGTSKIVNLLFNKFFGIKIILRMDGLFEDYRFKNPFYTLKGLKHNLSCIYSILISDKIIMQSNYIYSHLNLITKLFKHKISVIPNGVNFRIYKHKKKVVKDLPSILIVEGGIVSDYAKNIIEILSKIDLYPVGIYGKVHPLLEHKIKFEGKVKFYGSKERKLMPDVYKSYHIYFCIEQNPCCPNSVLEAMSSGLPILGFDNGSLKELVGDAGIIIKLGKKLNKIDDKITIQCIKKSINEISRNYAEYSNKARKRAITFDSDLVFDKYFTILTNK